MSLELAPEVEREVQENAARTGMSPSDFIRSLLKGNETHKITKLSQTQEERLAQAKAKMQTWQQEFGLPVPEGGFKSMATLFEQWRAEDAHMTEQEQEKERQFWAEFHAHTSRIDL
jgi:methylphosphotriester-DNA--protein-cysteine methyltransferase